jgi:hypothetical protein
MRILLRISVTTDGGWFSQCADHLYTRIVSTIKYSATANLYNSPQHPLNLFLPADFNSRSLVTTSSSGDSSASRA